MDDKIIWIVVIVVIVCALLIHIYFWKHYHYICPKCFHSFKPTFLRSLIAINAVEYRKFKCPCCNSTEYMEALNDCKKEPTKYNTR